ncbi:MAG TPA: hypothetical protein VMW42_05545 [Desulfatiglandales bacterium]|nr:hypothetical protein [Desulfatiglandales bacterium]
MKKLLLVLTLGLAFALILFPAEGKTQMGPGMMGQGGFYEDWNYCPYCGSYMGPEMMGPGYGRGYGRMHHGWGMGPHHGPQYGPRYGQPQKPLDEKDAKGILENYLQSTRNPNLKLGKVIEKDDYFEAEILTKDDSLADKVIVDKQTGWLRSIY